MTMKQVTLATAGFERFAKWTHRATFLVEMDSECGAAGRALRDDRTARPTPGNGRAHIGLERMLHICLLQP